jgi:hypothetical protein
VIKGVRGLLQTPTRDLHFVTLHLEKQSPPFEGDPGGSLDGCGFRRGMKGYNCDSFCRQFPEKTREGLSSPGRRFPGTSISSGPLEQPLVVIRGVNGLLMRWLVRDGKRGPAPSGRFDRTEPSRGVFEELQETLEWEKYPLFFGSLWVMSPFG